TFAVSTAQMDAWLAQILSLKRSLACLEGYIALEFAIPRTGRRIDAVVILKSICFVIEYKVGEEEYPNHAIEQVWDYALDLKNFHAASHDIPVVPVLVLRRTPVSLQTTFNLSAIRTVFFDLSRHPPRL